MANDLFYIELDKNPIRFDAASQLTNVFFDNSNKQIFAVRSNGATGMVVKGPTENDVISFCMNDQGPIQWINFSADNQVLAVQRCEKVVEFICFQNGQPQLQSIIPYNATGTVYGFVWVHNREIAIVSNSGLEILSVLTEKKQLRSVKSLSINIRWFSWCAEANIALLSLFDMNSLIPVIMKQKTITKLPKLDLGSPNREVLKSQVTLAQIYGVLGVLILETISTNPMEVEVYLLNGPGLAPRKCHVLRLGHTGRFAINIVDNLIVVHHQASATSLLFDIALPGEEVINNIIYHKPILPGRSIRPFSLKLPSLSPEGHMLQCDLYSKHWVLFQPNIVIDAKIGCLWYLNLCIDTMCKLLEDRILLVELLLHRGNGKQTLLKIVRQLVDDEYSGEMLPTIRIIFDKINKIYAAWVQSELRAQTAQPSTVKSLPKTLTSPIVLIEQSDMYANVFRSISECSNAEIILLLYLESLSKHDIAVQEDLTKHIIAELVGSGNLETLRRLVSYSLLMDSKAIACLLLSHSNADSAVTQIALDMLSKIKANEITIEVLLGQDNVIDALRLAKSSPEGETVSARKFLEAALKTKDDLLFHSVFKFFQMRNLRQRGSMDFWKTEQCLEFVQHYKNLCTKACT